jgi:hypothetical protein
LPPTRAKEYLRTPLASAWLILLIGSIVLGIWWRNHGVLRDQYDYSVVIAAAGKVEAGYRPYADVPSPMQSSVYLLNYFTEQVFGRHYLGLTLGGLVQALGGGLLLLGLLRRPLGEGGALVLTLAVVLAGLLQHMVFFYNTVGILCFSVVLLGMAVEPGLWPVRSARAGAILGALFLGGINKVNFHALTLVLAALLTLGAWQGGRLSRLGALRNGLLLILFGGVLPVTFELAWTGATYGQWLENVILGPSGYHDYLKRVFSPELYQRPVHDFYANILVPGIGGVGLGLLALTAAWGLFPARDRRHVVSGTLMRVALVVLGGVAGAALMLTNHETVLLTSLAYPVIATALFLFYREGCSLSERWCGWGREVMRPGTDHGCCTGWIRRRGRPMSSGNPGIVPSRIFAGCGCCPGRLTPSSARRPGWGRWRMRTAGCRTSSLARAWSGWSGITGTPSCGTHRSGCMRDPRCTIATRNLFSGCSTKANAAWW